MKPIQKPRKFIQGVNKDITISVALIYDKYSEYKKQCQKLMSDKDTKTFESY